MNNKNNFKLLGADYTLATKIWLIIFGIGLPLIIFSFFSEIFFTHNLGYLFIIQPLLVVLFLSYKSELIYVLLIFYIPFIILFDIISFILSLEIYFKIGLPGLILVIVLLHQYKKNFKKEINK